MAKKQKTKVNLHTLACELAKTDKRGGYDQDVIAAETTLHALGRKLRAASSSETLAILQAIVGRHK